MKATLDAKDLASAVAWAMRAVPAKSTTPVLGAVPLTVADGELTIAGYDYTTHARAIVGADGTLDTVHVLGSMLAKVAPQLNGTVALTIDGTRLRVAAGRDKYTVPIVPATDYPHTPSLPPAVGDSAGFLDAFGYVAQSAAGPAETSRAILQGVCLVAENGVLTLYATDRYRMSRTAIDWDGQDFSTVVPTRALTDFTKAVGVGRVTLHVSDAHFGITSGGYSASTLLLDDEYPLAAFAMIDRARASALADAGGILVAPRSELLGAVKRASIALGPNDPLALHLAEDGCSAVAVGDNGDASITIPGAYLGPDLDVYVTAAYLTSLIDATPAQHIALGAYNGKPMHIHVVGSHGDSGEPNEAVQHIVMARKAPSAMAAAA